MASSEPGKAERKHRLDALRFSSMRLDGPGNRTGTVGHRHLPIGIFRVEGTHRLTTSWRKVFSIRLP